LKPPQPARLAKAEKKGEGKGNHHDTNHIPLGKGKVGQQEKQGKQKDAGALQADAVAQELERFIATHPSGSFLVTEDSLRDAVAVYCALREWQAGFVNTAMADSDIKRSFEDLIPGNLRSNVGASTASFTKWVNERIGGEYRVVTRNKERLLMPTEVYESRTVNRDQINEDFFNKLPTDCFSPDEEAMREALVNYMDKCQQQGVLPGLSGAGSDEAVKKARQILLPGRSNGPSLYDWVLRRIGGEVGIVKGEKGPLLHFMDQDPPSSSSVEEQTHSRGQGKGKHQGHQGDANAAKRRRRGTDGRAH